MRDWVFATAELLDQPWFTPLRDALDRGEPIPADDREAARRRLTPAPDPVSYMAGEQAPLGRRHGHAFAAPTLTPARNDLRVHQPAAGVLLVALTALAERFGLESILGAFPAGAVIAMVDRATAAIGLLQATSLPFIVTATQLGMELGRLSATTAAALACAGLLSVLIFPPIALALLRDDGGRRRSAATVTRSKAGSLFARDWSDPSDRR